MRGFTKTWSSTLLLLCVGPSTHASVSLVSKANPTTIHIGDLVTYSVIVTRDDSTAVEFPSPGANLGAFEIRDFTPYKPRRQDGQILEQVDYVISTIDTGSFEIPPVAVRYRARSDTVWQELHSQPITIHVASLNPDESGDILDIEEPLVIAFDWSRVVRWSVLALVVLLAASFGFYYFRQRRRGAPLFPVHKEPPRPAHEVALEKLDRLFHSDLLEHGEVKLFHIRLSEILREYIEGCFEVPALEMTTLEIMQGFGDGQLQEEETEILRDFLAACDLVKFAKHEPEKEEIDETVNRAYEFVRLTQPKEPSTVEVEAADSEKGPGESEMGEADSEAVASLDSEELA